MPEIRPRNAATILIALLVRGVSANAADIHRGETLFMACLACHNSKAEAVGPSLTGVLGRKAGSLRGFRYSGAMRGSTVIWSDSNLRLFIENPQALIPGNRMAYDGMPNPADISDLIAYVDIL